MDEQSGGNKKTAKECLEALLQHWVSRHGVPAIITSDVVLNFVPLPGSKAWPSWGLRWSTRRRTPHTLMA